MQPRIPAEGSISANATIRTTPAAFGLIAILMLSAGLSPAFAADPPATVDGPKSCATANCHPTIESLAVLHAPVQSGACTMCHEPEAGNKHIFSAIPETSQSCLECHAEIIEHENIHKAAQQNCQGCHDPHGGTTRSMLKFGDQKSTCFECHEKSMMEAGFTHGPAASGACTLCHDPHSSKESNLLREPIGELCNSCHAELISEIKSATYLHKPLEEGCISCHNPHSGPAPRMLPGPAKVLCNQCHEKVVQTATASTVRHAPAEADDGCLSCHSPHGSDNGSLLISPQRNLCLSCHDKEVQSGTSTLQNMEALLEKYTNWHGPLKTGNCSGCHQSHGSENFRLLKKPFPQKFYSAFDTANYELCFSCHESALVQEENTTTLTNFRDGDRNLHFLHVNKEKRGRTCRACHEVHASSNPMHIRDTVPYGKWDLPIQFEKTATGGSCMPGCHEREEYNFDGIPRLAQPPPLIQLSEDAP